MEFLHSPPRAGLLFEFAADPFPTRVVGWNASQIAVAGSQTHFGFVGRGVARLHCPAGTFLARQGMYFALPDGGDIDGDGYGFVVCLQGYRGLFHLGGPIESIGRLRYIDGCSDTLLIAPPMLGDPCLNLLHIPPRTHQTSHTHPSLRVGMVIDGQGTCRTTLEETPLEPGLVFAIPPEVRHSFHTERSSLRIAAWHPDSDFGPTHDDHPMLNRTFVSGRPAKQTGVNP